MKEDEDEICINMKNCMPINMCTVHIHIWSATHQSLTEGWRWSLTEDVGHWKLWWTPGDGSTGRSGL